MPVYSYDPPERFIAGTVGQPGERTFYLQASAAGRVTSVSLEKFQVSLLAERLDELLDEVLRRRRRATRRPPVAPADDGPLDVPLLEDFRVGAIALAWDRDEERVVIEAQEETEAPVEPLTDDVPEDGPGGAAGADPASMARAFSQRALQIVARAGRPARCAGCRWTRTGTSARGRTGTGPAMPDRPAGRRGRRRQPGTAAIRRPRAAHAAEPRQPGARPRPGRPARGTSRGHRGPARTATRRARAADRGQPGGRGAAGRRLERHPVLHDQPRRRVAACVYKPVAGERPLWDFPTGTLAGREVAAYEVSAGGGLRTWCRPRCTGRGRSGPACASCGSTPTQTVDVLALARRTRPPGLRAMAVFDAVINNADRKIGHLLPAPGGRLYGCDHGVCFGEEYKLRTVLWQWRGRSLPGRSVGRAAPAAGVLDEGDLGRGPGRLAHRGRGQGDQGPARAAAQAQGAPVPAGGLARRPLAARVARVLSSPALAASCARRRGCRGGAGSARTRGRSRRRWPRAGRSRPWPLPAS